VDTLVQLLDAIAEKEFQLEKIKNKRDQEIAALEDEIGNLWAEHFKQSLIETGGL
jgi:hypothetical protein